MFPETGLPVPPPRGGGWGAGTVAPRAWQGCGVRGGLPRHRHPTARVERRGSPKTRAPLCRGDSSSAGSSAASAGEGGGTMYSCAAPRPPPKKKLKSPSYPTAIQCLSPRSPQPPFLLPRRRCGGGCPVIPAPRGAICLLIAPQLIDRARGGGGGGGAEPPPWRYFRAGGTARHLSRPVPGSLRPRTGSPHPPLHPSLPSFIPPRPRAPRAWLRRDAPAPLPPGGTKPPPMSSATSSAAGRVGAAPLFSSLLPAGGRGARPGRAWGRGVGGPGGGAAARRGAG